MDTFTDRKNRILWILDEVDGEAYEWVKFIINCNRDDKALPVEQRKPIKCVFFNYGGALEQAKMVSEIITLSKTPVYGIAVGMCASAASMIYLACHKRYATRNATLLLHKGSCDNIGGNYNQVQQFMESYKRDIDEMIEFYNRRTSLGLDEIREHMDAGDWYIYANEGLEKQLINEIVSDLSVFL